MHAMGKLHIKWLIDHIHLTWFQWYHFVQNDDVQRQTKQTKLTAIIQACRLTLFGHIAHMDDNADAKRILLASPKGDWRRPPRTSEHHMAKCHPARPEMSQSHTPWSSRRGSESLSVETGSCCRCQALCNLRVACQKRRCRWRFDLIAVS